MLKKWLSALLSASMLMSEIGLPVLANEQELVIEEMEDGTTDEIDSMDSSSSRSEDNSDNTNSDSTEDDLDENDLSDNALNSNGSDDKENPEEIDDSNQNNGNLGLTIDGVTSNNDPLVGSNNQNKNEYLDSGKIGTADWTIDKNGTLTIGPGEYEHEEFSWSWPWSTSKYISEIKYVKGTAPFILKGYGKYAFSELTSIEKIDLSGWDTSSVISMYSMFSYCLSLNSINLSNWDTSSVTDMSSMFKGCSSLTSLDLSNWDTSSVTDMSSMFEECSSLTSLNLSNWDTSSVTSMSYMFEEDKVLERIEGISQFNTSSLEFMLQTFKNCSSLTSLDLSNWDTSSVTNMSNLFRRCSSLTSLDLSKWDASSITKDEDIQGLFGECYNLYHIKYNGLCTIITSQLSPDWLWYQNEYGPYTVEWLTKFPIDEDERATLIREDHINDLIETEYQLSAKVEGDGKTVALNEPFLIQVSLIKNGATVPHWEDYTFTSINLNQIILNNTWDLGNARIFEVTPSQPGLIDLIIGDKKSGASINIKLEVSENLIQYTYPISKLEEVFYPNAWGESNTPTNFYNLNGLSINNYKHTETTKQENKIHKVSFDVYNTKYSYGSVDVYDKNGKLIKINEIKPRHNTTSLVIAGEKTCQVFSDVFNGRALSYTGEIQSQKTRINIEVPDGGYFIVSNNIMNSPGAMAFNSIDVMIFGINETISLLTANKEKAKTTFFDLFNMTDAQFAKAYPQEAAKLALKNSVVTELQKSYKKIIKTYGKNLMKTEMKTAYKISTDLMIDIGKDIINGLGLNWETLYGIFLGMSEQAFLNCLGPAGTALTWGFSVQKWTEKICLISEVLQSLDEPSLKLFTQQKNFTDLGEGVSVYPESDNALPNDAILQVYRLGDSSITNNFDDLDSLDYELFNLSLVKDGMEIHPNSTVRVVMDVPSQYDIDKVKLYRQEKDKSWTLISLNKDYSKRQISFLTDHFSLYMFAEESNSIPSLDPVISSSNNSNPASIIPKNEMHRLYNSNSGEHFYTADTAEKDHLASIGWNYEGVVWNAPKTSNTPVYRLYNENAGDHHYTTDLAEKDALVRIGWKDEGTGWYSDDNEGRALYRVYNPNAKAAGSHHYTLDSDEQAYLVSIGWNPEGIAWYGLK